MSSHRRQSICTRHILTTKDFDGHSVSGILSLNKRSHGNDKDIPHAGNESYNPDRHSEDPVSQEVLRRRKAVSRGHTDSDMGYIGAVSKAFQITEVKRERERVT